MEKNIKDAFSKYGLKGAIKYTLQRVTGMAAYEEKIDTLHYIINHYFDIKNFPSATGDLALVQKGDELLLAIVDIICRHFRLDYWVHAGTCLGATRHNGFIPWDDDTDICMMRDDYDRALEILPRELAKYGIDASENKDEPNGRIGISFNHRETGLWIDLLPCEYVDVDTTNEEDYHRCIKRVNKFYKIWRKKRNKCNKIGMRELKKRIIPEICTRENAKSILNNIEIGSSRVLIEISDVFPVRRATFGEYEVNVPNNQENYLTYFYGENYMEFPQSGMAHHGDERGPLTQWARMSGTDMDSVIKQLRDTYESLKSKYKI